MVHNVIIMKHGPSALIIIFYLYFLSACSFLVKETIFLPIEGKNWVILEGDLETTNCIRKYTYIKNEHGASYQCDNYNFIVGYLKYPTLVMSGPPLLPIIPTLTDTVGSLSITMLPNEKYKALKVMRPNCPEIVIHYPSDINIILQDTWYGDFYTNCIYSMNESEKNNNSIVMSFKYSNNFCESSELHLKSKTSWNYSPLCI